MAADFNRLMRAAGRLNARARLKNWRSGCHGKFHLPAVFFVTDPDRTPDPVGVVKALPRFPRRRLGVIFRHFGAKSRLKDAKVLSEACRKRGALLLIAADPGLAARAGAQGVHLPERMAHKAARLKQRHPTWLVTVAAHGGAALRRGKGADAFLVSPVFQTDSAGAAGRKRLGARGLAGMGRQTNTPIYAMGGLNVHTIKRIQGLAGIAGVALASGFNLTARKAAKQ